VCGALRSIRFSRLRYISEGEGRGRRGRKFDNRVGRDSETTKASAAFNLVGRGSNHECYVPEETGKEVPSVSTDEEQGQ
jgi:hypothetical protein